MIRRAALCLLSAAGLVAALVGPAWATPGVLDTTFGTNGLVRTDMSPRGDTIWGTAIQPGTDDIVAVGSGGGPNTKFAVALYNANGSPDTSFSTDGEVLTDIGPYKDEAISVVFQGSQIVVAGGAGLNGPDPKFAVVRYNANGSLDDTFGGGDGIETIDVSKHYDLATGVGILSNGDILVAGGAAEDRNNADFAAVALNGTDGSPDTSFGTAGTGIVRTDISGGSYDAGNSNVVVNGTESYIGGFTFPAGSANGRFAVVSYNNDGSLNSAFNGGIATANFTGGFDYASGMALNGSDIVAVGESGYQTSLDQAALAEFTSAGVLDSSFGTGGKVQTNYGKFGDVASGVAVDGSGNIVTAGGIGLGGPNPKFAVCRYLPNGTLDSTFGTLGHTFTDFGPFGDVADAVAIQSTGRIIAAGGMGAGSGNSRFGLAGYEAS